MLQKINIIALIALITPMTTLANNCFSTDVQFLGSTTVSVDTTCYVETPLNLLSKDHYYYSIKGGIYLNVDYWAGGWAKKYKSQESHMLTVKDWCTTGAPEVLFQKTVTKVREHVLRKVLTDSDNPNLYPYTQYTYMLSPMTWGEAQTKFNQLQASCQSAQP